MELQTLLSLGEMPRPLPHSWVQPGTTLRGTTLVLPLKGGHRKVTLVKDAQSFFLWLCFSGHKHLKSRKPIRFCAQDPSSTYGQEHQKAWERITVISTRNFPPPPIANWLAVPLWGRNIPPVSPTLGLIM